jgi:hypothetical protein
MRYAIFYLRQIRRTRWCGAAVLLKASCRKRLWSARDCLLPSLSSSAAAILYNRGVIEDLDFLAPHIKMLQIRVTWLGISLGRAGLYATI